MESVVEAYLWQHGRRARTPREPSVVVTRVLVLAAGRRRCGLRADSISNVFNGNQLIKCMAMGDGTPKVHQRVTSRDATSHLGDVDIFVLRPGNARDLSVTHSSLWTALSVLFK